MELQEQPIFTTGSKLLAIIDEKVNLYEKYNGIIAFKGLPLDLIAKSSKINFQEKAFFVDGKLDIEKLSTSEGKKLLIEALGFQQEESRILTYEALLFGYKDFNSIIEDDIIIVDLSVSPYNYPGIINRLPAMEDFAEEGKNIKDNNITSLFASVVTIGEKEYVQYRDQELLKSAAIRDEVFPPMLWDSENLTSILETEKLALDLEFNFESRDYVQYLDLFLKQEIKSCERIIVDASIKSNPLASEQLGKILNFFEILGVKPNIYRLKYDLTVSARPELQDQLKETWGYNNFRTLKIYNDPEISKETIEISQATIIETIVEEYEKAAQEKNFDDVFVTAPTGAGKSIMFQLPAIYLGKVYNTISIVVTPLISLMADQVKNLQATGYTKVAYINSEISIVERDDIYEQIKNGEIDLLYLAPELLLSYDIRHFLQGRKLGLYIIDEAHTVTTWGRDFRVDYWYLGPHIHKVRKYYEDENGKKIKFPVVAFTATAPYDGIHDVVFETLNSLKIVSAKKFIGYVRRENIEFKINHVQLEGNLETEKAKLTVERLKEYSRDGKKTVVYCPFRTHVNEVHRTARAAGLPIHRYHGQLPKEEKKLAQEEFGADPEAQLVATKAFGMGVDIPDIEQVYHFAPTGLLTDYVQEIGRAARKSSINGKAIVDYSNRDFQFINRLHGLNRTFDWQLKEIMKRLLRFYDDNQRQNQLVSAEDFDYIFNKENEDDLQQDVKSALMLLEKDLNKKTGNIPVLIARPKNLFATVYASLPNSDLQKLESFVPKKSLKRISYPQLENRDKSIVQLKLNKIWEEKFSDKNFGVIKRDFFKETLFKNIELRPKLKIALSINDGSSLTLEALKEHFDTLNIAFRNLTGKFFKKGDLSIQLRLLNKDPEWSIRVADFILPLFSQRSYTLGNLTQNDVRQKINFLQSRTDKNTGETEYRVVDGALNHIRATVRRKVSTSFNGSKKVVRYLDTDGPEKQLYVKIGQFLEIFELGNYEVNGGENPKIFIRINDPFRLRSEAYGDYRNSILQNIRDRNEAGINLMKEFFESDRNSEERWDFIEDYFLGRIE